MTTTTDSISIQAAKEHPLPQFSAGQQIGGVYEVVEKLDEGMLGAVYKVKHRKSGEIVALKLLRPQLLVQGMNVDRFNHEVQILRQATHPGLVDLLDSGEHDGTLFFTMEFIDGRSLRAILNEYQAKGSQMNRREMLDVLTGLLKVLDEIHPANLHRNLKPENILVKETKGSDGKIKREIVLTDQAISKVVSLAGSSLDREGAWYLAPEMSEFRDKATPSSDLYSVGAIFYEMLTGYPPVGRYELPSEILDKEVSEMVDDLVEIALAPNPQDRFQTAEDMLAAVLETFSDLYGSSDTNIKRVMLLLLILVLVAAAAAVYFRQSAPTEEELVADQMAHRAEVLARVHAAQEAGGAPAVTDPMFEEMAWIPGGPYVSGKWSAYDGETAAERMEREVNVGGFWIDKYEMHLAPRTYGEEDTEEVIAETTAWNDHRAYEVDRDRTWTDAKALCHQVGKRLCTEDEWEKACKGPENWSYTYGNDFEPKRCPDSGYVPPYKAIEHPACVSGYGVYDLGGGVAEWTSTKYVDRYIVKPGPRGEDAVGTRCSGRADYKPGFAQIHVGIRCCAD
jgi:hypothetical protein